MMTVTYCIEQATSDGVVNPDVLRALLVAREDNMADHLRLAGAQFGLIPELVAAVIADLGLGTPLSDEERIIIRNNFINKMREITEGES
jgi:hypothetical protein